jgi:hypothetical protein
MLTHEDILLLDLYKKSPTMQFFSRARIVAHYNRMRLARRGVVAASVRYIPFNRGIASDNVDIFNRQTGFHGESGGASSGGHLTVDFWTEKTHFATQHVYETDDGYRKKRRGGKGRRRGGKKRLT